MKFVRLVSGSVIPCFVVNLMYSLVLERLYILESAQSSKSVLTERSTKQGH